MIGSLTGTIAPFTKSSIIVDVGGVGYLVHVPDRILETLSPDTTYTLFIHTHVREDALDLYGFLSTDELHLFKLLLTVSGIGPRTALSIINRGVDMVKEAVSSSDVDFFTTIPRLGKKNAQKIIIELKSKLGSIRELDLVDSNSETKQLLDALMSMGFGRNECIEIIKKLDRTEPIEQQIRNALKLL